MNKNHPYSLYVRLNFRTLWVYWNILFFIWEMFINIKSRNRTINFIDSTHCKWENGKLSALVVNKVIFTTEVRGRSVQESSWSEDWKVFLECCYWNGNLTSLPSVSDVLWWSGLCSVHITLVISVMYCDEVAYAQYTSLPALVWCTVMKWLMLSTHQSRH